MPILQAFILGIVQGLTEFIPVSSSGHLVMLPLVFGWHEPPLAFDTTLHLGTALALVLYFWKDLWHIFFEFLHKGFKSSLAVNIFIASIPAGILGLLIGDFIEEKFRSLLTVALLLILGSALMFYADLKAKNASLLTDETLTKKKSLIVGLFQSLALFPGVSRSGATISGGMLVGMTREAAARFSFLISVPIVVLAGVFSLIKSFNVLGNVGFGPMFTGFLASFVAGLFAIGFLMEFLKKKNLTVFIMYRLALACVLLWLVLK